MNSLSSDELAAILALGNLTENRIDANAEIISTSHSSRKSEPENESDYDNVEDEEDDDDDDDDNSDCEDDSSSGSDLSISVAGISPVSDNTEQCIEETVKKMRSVCSESLMIVLRERLDTIIRRVCVKSYLSASTFLKNIMKDNDDIHLQFLEEIIADKEFLFKMEVLLKATVVYFLSLQMVNTHDEMDSVDELLKEYSQYLHFAECADDAEEAQYILCYRNYMKKALCIIPAKRNKLLLVSVCSLLEGSRRTYITGGTQSSATTRRIVVYEHESGYRKKCRPKRRQTSSASSSAAKKKKKSMEMVTCSCGAVIRKRTLWKHHRSKKHQKFLHPIPASSSADSKIKPKATKTAKPSAAKSAKQKFKVRALTATSIKPQRPPLYLPQCQPNSAPPAIHTLPTPAIAGPHFHQLSELQLSHLVAHNVHNMGGRSPSPLELSVNYPFPPEQSLQYLVPHHGGPQNYSLPPYNSSATTTNTSASLQYDCHSHPYPTQLQPASASASEMYQLSAHAQQQLSVSSISLSPRLPYAQLYSQVQSFPLFCAPQGALSSSNPSSASASASRLVHVIQVDPRYVYQLPPSWM